MSRTPSAGTRTHPAMMIKSDSNGPTVVELQPLLTTEEVAEHFRVNPSTVRRWRLDGVGPCYVKVGSVYRYPQAALAKWLHTNLTEEADAS